MGERDRSENRGKVGNHPILTDLDRFAEACQAIFSTKVDIDPASTWVVV